MSSLLSRTIGRWGNWERNAYSRSQKPWTHMLSSVPQVVPACALLDYLYRWRQRMNARLEECQWLDLLVVTKIVLVCNVDGKSERLLIARGGWKIRVSLSLSLTRYKWPKWSDWRKITRQRTWVNISVEITVFARFSALKLNEGANFWAPNSRKRSLDREILMKNWR